jgi:hypothetical protein
MNMDLEKEEITETQPEFDTAAAVADISSDLFGQSKEGDTQVEDSTSSPGEVKVEGEEKKSSDAGTVDAADSPPQPGEEKKEEENSEAVQETGAPKTWTKDALEKWATIDPRVQQEILKREDDFMKGITQYKAAADVGVQYSKVVEPYAPMLAAENLDPVQLFQNFAANHYTLSRGSNEQKVQLAAMLIDGYNIPLEDLLNHIADSGGEKAPPSPEIISLRKELDDLKAGFSQRTESERAVIQQRLSKEVEEFAKDPAHPHFDELADDITQLFANGSAKSLQEAYDKAVYANPTTRQKEIDRLTAEALTAKESEEKKRLDKVAKSTADHVETTPTNRGGTVPVGTMDDTLHETMAKIASRG